MAGQRAARPRPDEVDAYRWPAEVDEDAILGRMLTLDQGRAGEQ
jgi:hypothetical protein